MKTPKSTTTTLSKSVDDQLERLSERARYRHDICIANGCGAAMAELNQLRDDLLKKVEQAMRWIA